ncbi:MAG TPA: mechanosensitive ion channel family protein [Candidatus Babeliales bacterium]|nr:mechanosensitive ion channel family protein [Candidatus Babeliales bacterium]
MSNVSLMMYVGNMVRIGILLCAGIPLVRWCSGMCAVFCGKRFSHHMGVIVGRIIFYSGILFIAVTVLHEFGFNVTALLGAAGVLGVAIGFASQTSISNIISGFFLVLERPFSIGDIIKSGDIVGVVESIDLLSVRVCTLDNKLIRLPNELVLKQYLTNLTYYPVKRIDCILSAPYSNDVEDIKAQIYTVIKNNGLFLHEPAPVVMLHKIGQHDYDTETRIFFTVRVWVTTDKFSSASAVLMQQIKDQFDTNKTIITVVHNN